jgi:peroxiredoxin
MEKIGLNDQKGGATMFASIIVCVAIVITAAAFSRLKGLNNDEASSSAGHMDAAKSAAPDFKLKDLAGKEVRLSDFKGKVVMVNFWATWCPPCVLEVPSFVKLRNLYHARGLEIIGISLDGGETEAVAGFAKKLKINYPIVMGTNDTVVAYGPMSGIPVTIIIDREGRIQSRLKGMMSFEKIEGAVKPLL